jgi:hypothetical protein
LDGMHHVQQHADQRSVQLTIYAVNEPRNLPPATPTRPGIIQERTWTYSCTSEAGNRRCPRGRARRQPASRHPLGTGSPAYSPTAAKYWILPCHTQAPPREKRVAGQSTDGLDKYHAREGAVCGTPLAEPTKRHTLEWQAKHRRGDPAALRTQARRYRVLCLQARASPAPAARSKMTVGTDGMTTGPGCRHPQLLTQGRLERRIRRRGGGGHARWPCALTRLLSRRASLTRNAVVACRSRAPPPRGVLGRFPPRSQGTPGVPVFLAASFSSL